MRALPAKQFDSWTLDDVRTAAELEPISVMAESGKRVFGPRRRLLTAMEMADATVAGDLDGPLRDQFLFLLVLWPTGARR